MTKVFFEEWFPVVSGLPIRQGRQGSIHCLPDILDMFFPWFTFYFRVQFSRTLENIGVSGIGTVGEGMGMGIKDGKDDPMQLSDILPKTLMYDKMRPPKVEGDITNWMLNTTPLRC